MSSSIPKLVMYPLYSGGPQVKDTNGLNANSVFHLKATKFSPAYGVNTTETSRWDDSDRFLKINGTGNLGTQSVSNTASFNRNLGFDGSVLGGLKSVSAPGTAPGIPDLYASAARLLSVSDLKFTELMSQASFTIPNIGLGLKVTTDGAGNVDTIAISPSMQKAFPQLGPRDPEFRGTNTAKIVERAVLRAPKATPVNAAKKSQIAANKPANAFLNVQAPNKLDRANQALFNLNALEVNRNLDTQALRQQAINNPVLERLLRLQPQDAGLSVSGQQAGIGPAEATIIAAAKADFGVSTSDQFKRGMASWVQDALQNQGNSYLQLSRLKEGQMPMAPSLPAATKSAAEAPAAFSGNNSLSADAGVADSGSKRSSGGYIPFQMSSGHNPFQAAVSTTAGQTGGQTSQQQQKQQRRPLAFMA